MTLSHTGAAEPQGVEVQAPWRMLRRGKAKTAFSIKELVGLTSDFSVQHAPNCSSQVIRTEATKFLLVYKVTCRESYSAPGGHTVRFKFDFKRMQASGRVDDLDVRVSCSCPAFLWWGAQWNLSTGDALYGKPVPKLQPPTDPKRYQFVICKHVKVVANRINPVLERMLGVHRTKQDEELEKQKEQEVQVTKQRTQLDVEQKKKELAPQERTPVTPVKPEDEDLDAMPEDLTTLGLPPKIEPPKDVEPTKPVTKRPTIPKDLIPESTRRLLKLPETPKKPLPKNIKLVEEDEEPSAGPKARRMLPSNIKVHEDEDETVTLPGSKARRMVQQESAVDLRHEGDVGPKARRMITPKPGKPKGLPPNIKLIDDASDDEITKINRLKLSGLILAAVEV